MNGTEDGNNDIHGRAAAADLTDGMARDIRSQLRSFKLSYRKQKVQDAINVRMGLVYKPVIILVRPLDYYALLCIIIALLFLVIFVLLPLYLVLLDCRLLLLDYFHIWWASPASWGDHGTIPFLWPRYHQIPTQRLQFNILLLFVFCRIVQRLHISFKPDGLLLFM